MKKALLTLLGIIVVVGILAGAGFAGYRIGYKQGAARTLATLKSTTKLPQQNNSLNTQNIPMHNFGNGFDPQGMPMMRNFGNGSERGFNREMGPGGFGMMNHSRGFGLFGPLQFLVHVAIWALIFWAIYIVIKGSGWKLSRTQVPAQAVKTETQDVEPK